MHYLLSRHTIFREKKTAIDVKFVNDGQLTMF